MNTIKYNRLQEVLNMKGLSQGQFARLTNLQTPNINRICNNKVQMSWERVQEWAVLLEVSPLDLIQPNEFEPKLKLTSNRK